MVEVPKGTGGAQLVLRDVPSTARVTLTSPSGRELADADLFVPPQHDRALRVITLTNPDAPIEAGQWLVDVSPPPERYQVTSRFSPELEEGEIGVFDLRFVLAANCLADSAATQAALERALRGLGPTLFVSHLELGEVVFEERRVSPCSVPPAWLGVLRDFATDRQEFVFVVTNQLESGELYGYAPIGGTLSEPSSLFGAGALSDEGLSAGNLTPSAVILHELGHWAGLQHSVESEGSIDARQEVRCDGEGSPRPGDCWPGKYNVMFWAPTSPGVTAPQVRQLRRGLATRRSQP